jgi:hypothetical protein
MTIRLTRHAVEQISKRSVTTESEVFESVNRLEGKITASNCFEVRVIVRRLSVTLTTPDGSTGDLIIACIDPTNRTIKTVMLQNSWQAAKKSKEVPYYG